MPNPTRLLLLAILPACRTSTTACLTVPADAPECPAPEDVDLDELLASCGSRVVRITGEGVLDDGDCARWWSEDTAALDRFCEYPIRETKSTCEYGRPLLVDGEPRVASLGAAPRGWSARVRRPRLEGLSASARESLALRWTRAALDEHAAVAAFSRVALDLLAHGAPAALVADTHAAAADEIRHARLGFALAGHYAGRCVEPAAFPMPPFSPSPDLIALARAAAREGCVGETVSALLAAEAGARAVDPAPRAVLAVIARDERAHAALAWRTARWALDRGGDAVRGALAEVFADVARRGVEVPLAGSFDDPAVLVPHGLLDREATRSVASEAVREVILPGARAILGATARDGAAEA